VTKPLDPQSLRVRRLIKDARAAGLEVYQVWELVDGTVKLVTKVPGATEGPVEEEGDTWADVA
jgi:hypothetical protein